MDAFSHEDWPIQRLAGVSGVSKAHFARSFLQAFGMPPHRYLLTRRIERAKALLRDTDLAVTGIAFEKSPGAFRVRERGVAQGLGKAPACYLSAAHRPDLTIAVSEKRRQDRNDKPAGILSNGGPMSEAIQVVGLYVRDQDEAYEFYVGKLGFRVHTDQRNGDYRWLTVQHPEQPSFQFGLFLWLTHRYTTR